jgi:hypothetical protein
MSQSNMGSMLLSYRGGDAVMSYPTPIGDQLVEEYRCQDRGGPDGQRCQLLIEHDPPHIASISGTVRGWTDGEAEVPPGPYRWAPTFPRDEA